MATIKVGISDQDAFTRPDPRGRRRLLDRVAAAGLDHVTVGDHIAFHGGTGFDGLITASTLLASHESLPVLVGVYLLGLRHPMLAARQLSTLAQVAPGRLTLGIGVAGEDRREVSNAGSIPVPGVGASTRRCRWSGGCCPARRSAIRASSSPSSRPGSGQPRSQAIPMVIGGKGEAAVRRTAALGDGWLGMFCSARRFAETRSQILAGAADLGREAPPWFGVNVWCGLDPDPEHARDLLADKMERLYRLPYEKFRYLAPAGTPKQVAEFLRPFTEAGAEHVTLVPAGASVEAEIDAAAEVREHLRA